MFLKLGDYFIEIEHITALKAVGKKSCNIWVMGASTLDGGFLVNLPTSEVLELIDNAHMAELAMMLARAEESDLGEAEDLQARKVRQEREAQEGSREEGSLAP